VLGSLHVFHPAVFPCLQFLQASGFVIRVWVLAGPGVTVLLVFGESLHVYQAGSGWRD
jgi:hypothetical protein